MNQRSTRAADANPGEPTPGKAAPARSEESQPQRIGHSIASTGLTRHINAPRSLAEAEEQYVTCRDAWTAAMRAASSGRPADMATLAICQEAYEAASLERERWRSGARVAIPIEQPKNERPSIEVVVEQALAWRDVHAHERDKPRGVLGRLFGRRGKS